MPTLFLASTPVNRTYRRVLYYGLPMLFCLAVHQFALKTWFFQDDFAWLALPLDIGSPSDLLRALFSPKAEGTMRIFSERLYFLVFSSIFGIDVVPFKIWTFLTQLANIALLIQVTRRLTGSSLAGFLAAILWTANAGLAMALGWSSSYNEVAFAFVILLAFWLFLRYVDTGQQKYWVWQWVVFLLGFGVLELIVTYPALAAGYALCCARPYFRKTLYLFIPSILFIAAHFAFIAPSADPHYQMHFGSSPLAMLWTYWSFVLGALRDVRIDWRPLWLGLSVTIAISLALAFFAAINLRRRDRLPLFLLGWFVVVISPVLPLRNHFTEYYVLVPSIGLVILGGWALADARGFVAVAGAALAALYLTISIADLHTTELFFYNRARTLKYIVLGLKALPETETTKAILLDGVDNNLFRSGLSDDPFRLLGLSRVYLTPGSEALIDPQFSGLSRFVISLNDAISLLTQNQALVFELKGRDLRDITERYLARAQMAAHPEFVDVGDLLYQGRLGPTWYQIERNFRWMPKTATLRIAGPRQRGQTLEVTGYCPAAVLARGPLQVSFRGDGIEIGSARLDRPDQHFDLKLPLPSTLVGRQWIEVEVEVSRTILVGGGDPRTLGLVLQTFRIE
jgi:hypothetical protein